MLSDKYKILNRDEIKFIAITVMLLNHIVVMLLSKGVFVYELIASLGFFTMVTMIYFLIEGYHYTHSKLQYALRLFIFAVISQIPYHLATPKDENILYGELNVLFSLLLCFFLIAAMNNIKNIILRIIIILIAIVLSCACDWPVYAPIYTLLFIRAQKTHKTLKAFLIAALLFAPLRYLGVASSLPVSQALIITFFSAFCMYSSGLCIAYFYNGKRAQTHRQFSKWFFYIFYPLHLFIISFVKVALS